MTTQNRPYLFELAAVQLDAQRNNGDVAGVRQTAAANGLDPAQLDRAVHVLERIAAGGTNIADFIRQEYIVDGWLQGYLPLEASPADQTLTTFLLSQIAETHYGQPSA